MTVIDTYLADVPADKREALERVRQIIHSIVPEPEETIGYNMPVIRYKGKYLVGFAAFKNHMSLFPGAFSAEGLEQDLRDFVQAKGTIQFTVDKQLPKDVIVTIVTRRMTEIDT